MHRVSKIIVHERYGQLTGNDHDVALLKLSKPIRFSSRVRAIPLASSSPNSSSLTQVSGWGNTDANTDADSTSDYLLYVNLPSISRSRCKQLNGASRITDDMICAGNERGGQDCKLMRFVPVFL